MQQQTGEKENATYNTLDKSNETHNSASNLIERKIIENTPFYVVRQTMDNDKNKYFMVMGDYRLTEPTETEKETLEKLVTEHWLILANIVAITVEKTLSQYGINYKKPYETESL